MKQGLNKLFLRARHLSKSGTSRQNPAPRSSTVKWTAENLLKWQSVTNTCASSRMYTQSTISQRYNDQKMRTYNNGHLPPASAQLPQCSIRCTSDATTCQYHIQYSKPLESFTSSLGKAARKHPIYFSLFARIFTDTNILFVQF